MSFSIDITGIPAKAINQINDQLPARAASAALLLRNASLEVLSGQRSGKRYKKPGGGYYRASAPGEPPAVRTGRLRGNWRPIQCGANGQNPAIETTVFYARYMENGTPGGMIAPRPFVQKIVDKAKPGIEGIYAQPFHLSF